MKTRLRELAPAAKREPGGEITQPSLHHLAKYCTSNLPVKVPLCKLINSIWLTYSLNGRTLRNEGKVVSQTRIAHSQQMGCVCMEKLASLKRAFRYDHTACIDEEPKSRSVLTQSRVRTGGAKRKPNVQI